MKNDKKTLKMLSIFAKFASKNAYKSIRQVNITANHIEATDSYHLLRLNEPQDEPEPVEDYPDTSVVFDEIEKKKYTTITLNPKYVINVMQAFKALEKNKNVKIHIPMDGNSPVKFTANASNLIGVIMPIRGE